MTAPFAHISEVVDVVRDGLHDWAKRMIEQAGVRCSVVGSIPDKGGPALVLLPYQMVLESQHTVPSVQLMPSMDKARREPIPKAWRTIGSSMTDVLIETFPAKPRKGPGVGPLNPAPPLDALPAPVAAWYRAHAKDWVVDNGAPAGRLPAISWRQPYSIAVRFAAIVVDPDRKDTVIDATRLKALAIVGAGVRLERFFEVEVPPLPASEELVALMTAFGQVDAEGAAPLAEAIAEVTAKGRLAVGLTPHNELTDADLALVCMALKQPMQPSVVFSLRISLGAGPELGAGAMPHISSVDGAER